MILLFGSGGFIGRHVREALGDDVVEVPRERIDLTTASHDDLTGLLYEVAPDTIVNCAGATTGDAQTLTRTNVAGVARLLCAVTTAAPKARFVHVGCAAEYGGTPMGSPIGEETECRPAGDYGVTKLAATELVRAAAADGLDAVALRVFSVIGAGAPPKSLPMRLARGLREEGDLVVGGLEVYRDFVDVRDVARAVALAVRASGTLPPVLNVGSGRATAVRDLITTLVEIARPGTRVVPGATRTPAIPWQAADITRAAESLAWRAEIPLRTTLETLWNTVQEPAGTSPATTEAADDRDEAAAVAGGVRSGVPEHDQDVRDGVVHEVVPGAAHGTPRRGEAVAMQGWPSLAWYVGSGQGHGAWEADAANAPTAPWHMQGRPDAPARDAGEVAWPGEWRPTGTGGGTT